VKCHACGQDNADSALFCTACRRPLVAPSKAPTRLEPLAPVAPSVATPPPPPPGDVGGRNRYAPPDAGTADNGSRLGDPSQVLTDEEIRAAVIGNSNTLYYLGRFERIAHGEGGGWNWPAFLVTWYWLLYRKMWVPATLYFFAPYLVLLLVAGIGAASPMFGAVLWLAWALAWLIAPGMLANGWYYKHCLNKIRDVRARGGSKDQVLARLEAVGGTSNVAIIIVAVVCVFFIPGILAAIALPAYQTYTVKAKVAEAIVESTAVATVVGRQYEATGQFPSDIDRIARQVPQQSKYVQGIELDSITGTLTVHVEASPTIAGTILFVPSADSSRHVTWSCSSADLIKYVPKSCRG
jgi:Tfp pilus assembly major pilin PilA